MIPKRAPQNRPQSGEYASYYEKYVSLIPGDDILGTLETQRLQMALLLAGRSERDGNFRYAAGKWTVKEVIGHIGDCERIFSYRALRISRGDRTPIEGFEQDDYVRNGGFGDRTLADLALEFDVVRNSTVSLLRTLSGESWQLRGIANKNEVSVRALAFIIAGHELHHRRILEEQYFPSIPRA
jgi:DinB superfamily